MTGSTLSNGVFAAPRDSAPLRRLVDAWRTVDLRHVDGKSGLLTALAHALAFPAHFGHNWDALADALQDLGWMRWSGLVIELENIERLRLHAAEEWRVALDILSDAATFWGKQGKAFVVIVHAAVDLPPMTI